MMADKTTPNTNTAHLTLDVQTSGATTTAVVIDFLLTTSPAYTTNAYVTYYLKVTLSDYLYRYPTEAVYYE